MVLKSFAKTHRQARERRLNIQVLQFQRTSANDQDLINRHQNPWQNIDINPLCIGCNGVPQCHSGFAIYRAPFVMGIFRQLRNAGRVIPEMVNFYCARGPGWQMNQNRAGTSQKTSATVLFIFVPPLQTSSARFRIFTVHSAHGGIQSPVRGLRRPARFAPLPHQKGGGGHL